MVSVSWPLVALVLGSFPFLSSAQTDQVANRTGISLDTLSLAVMPIENLGTRPEFTFAEHTLNQEILLGLETINGLNVTEPDQVRVYDSSELLPVDIARQLGVGAIVVGSLHENDQGLSVRIEQIAGDSGDVVWVAVFTMSAPTVAEVKMMLPSIVARTVESVRISVVPTAEGDDELIVRDAQAVVLNANVGERERLRAYSQLRSREGGLSRDVVAAIAGIGSNSQNANIRLNAWVALVDAEDAYLVEPLLRSLNYDTDRRVRRVVAEVLIEYVAEAGVREALAYASINDETEDVRAHVRFLLLPEPDQRKLQRSRVLDASLPDATRFDALVGLSGVRRLAGGRMPDIDDGVAIAAVEMALTSPDPGIRSQIWSYLPGVDKRYRIDALSEQLANDLSESVREAAAQHLRDHLEEPRVREALDHSRNNDQSPAVRREAARALRAED